MFDPIRAAPQLKYSDEVFVQANYMDAVVSARPELSKFFVPLIAFEVQLGERHHTVTESMVAHQGLERERRLPFRSAPFTE